MFTTIHLPLFVPPILPYYKMICWFQSYFFAQHIAEICSCFIYIIFNIAHNNTTDITCKYSDYILYIKTFY